MKYVDEFRQVPQARRWAAALKSSCSRDWTIMEVCGGQTHSIVRFGIDAILPGRIRLLHGPGCPVCVTPVERIDAACAIARQPGVILCSFGDMMRVPGSGGSLFTAKSKGADVRLVYSPMDALRVAEENPDRRVVFFAVGFETTAPANAMTVFRAREKGIGNFSLLSSHVLVPPALRALLSDKDCRVNGFLAAGHVCAVMGYEEYGPIAAGFKVPIVVTGFEPMDLLKGISCCVQLLEQGRPVVENQYARAVRKEGNREARKMIELVFQTVDRNWRGIGVIPASGLDLRPEFRDFDALQVFGQPAALPRQKEECRSGLVLQGRIKPDECPFFASRCTPENPMGATMVSSEGACAAYFRYRPPSA